MSLRKRIAHFLAPEEFEALEKARADLQLQVNQRVADVLFKMDPFEPLLNKYHVAFPHKWEDARPEDDLDSMGAMRLYMWAYGMRSEVNFNHLVGWLRNRQGNATLRKGRHDDEWFFGRAIIATLTLFVDEIGRLSSKYEEVMASREQTFDRNLPVGEY